jgi:hypothetical protein
MSQNIRHPRLQVLAGFRQKRAAGRSGSHTATPLQHVVVSVSPEPGGAFGLACVEPDPKPETQACSLVVILIVLDPQLGVGVGLENVFSHGTIANLAPNACLNQFPVGHFNLRAICREKQHLHTRQPLLAWRGRAVPTIRGGPEKRPGDSLGKVRTTVLRMGPVSQAQLQAPGWVRSRQGTHPIPAAWVQRGASERQAYYLQCTPKGIRRVSEGHPWGI